MSESHISAPPSRVPAPLTSVSIADCKNRVALFYFVASAAPALYLAPIVMLAMLILAWLEELVGTKSLGRPIYLLPLSLLLLDMLVTGLASGLPVREIFSYNAIRYDANVFYSTLPLFLLRNGKISIEVIDRWIQGATIVATVAYLLSALLGVSLYESHNAAGGFFMILLAFLCGRALVAGWTVRLVPIILAIVCLGLSDSRGSAVAVAIVIAFHLTRIRYPKLAYGVLMLVILGFIGTLIFCYQVWQANGSIYLYDYSDYSSVASTLPLDQLSFGERPGTIFDRLFFLYPMAIDMFLQSPIFGIGFTRFDDFPAQYGGWPGVVSFNVTSYVHHTDLHAHNSYLHIAAETGIVGVVLLAWFLRAIFRAFEGQPKLAVPVELIVGALMIASLTEHRLTTPSQAAPTFILVALLWICKRTSSSGANTLGPAKLV